MRWSQSLFAATAAAGCVLFSAPSGRADGLLNRWSQRKDGQVRGQPSRVGSKAEAVQGAGHDESAVLVLNPALTPQARRGPRMTSPGANESRHAGAVTVAASERLSPADRELAAFEAMALAQHVTLRQAQAAIDAAAGRQIQSRIRPNPTIGYVGSEIGNEGRGGQQGIVLGQEIVRSEKLLRAGSVADCRRTQAEIEATVQWWRVRNTVRTLYFDALAAAEMRRLTDEIVALAEQGVSVATQREKAGEGTLTETLQAQIELEQVRILAANSANRQHASWKRLVAYIGRPDMDSPTLEGRLELPHGTREEAATLAKLRDESPEVQSAEAAVQCAAAVLERARVESVPNLTLEAGTQYDFASHSQITNFGVSVPIPIRDRNQGNIAAAESEWRRAREEVTRVRLTLTERFAGTFARYRSALEQVERYGARLPEPEVRRILGQVGDDRQKALEAHPQILPRAQLALALATEGWQRGEFNYLHVLTAQRTLMQVSLNYVRSLADLRQTLVLLDGFLLGDGPGAKDGSSLILASESLDNDA